MRIRERSSIWYIFGIHGNVDDVPINFAAKVVDNYKADIYWNKISRKKDRSPL